MVVGLANVGLLSKFPNMEKYRGLIEPTVEVVGDMMHLHPFVMQLILSSKNHKNISWVTDALLEPNPTSSVTYGGRELEVKQETSDRCKVVLKGTNVIAGSCSTQLHLFHTLVRLFDVPLEQAVDMLAHNPARIAKLDKQHIGSLCPGNRGDVLLFDKDLRLSKTLVAGQIVFDRHHTDFAL